MAMDCERLESTAILVCESVSLHLHAPGLIAERSRAKTRGARALAVAQYLNTRKWSKKNQIRRDSPVEDSNLYVFCTL